ncbi:MAG: folate-binding protein YgfZ [Planctomycetes bacterium]|nr:folate-binding protein YgfZ [Planctomycetota bacterium]
MTAITQSSPLKNLHHDLGARFAHWLGGEVAWDYGDFERDWRAFTSTDTVIDVSPRSQLELVGPDRASFLHSLSTNDIKQLATGASCEASFLNGKGNVLFHGWIHAGESSHIVDVGPGMAAPLAAHLTRYQIREQVTVHDRTREWGLLYLAGPTAADKLHGDALQSVLREATVVPDLWTRHEAWHLFAPRERLVGIWSALTAAGFTPVGARALDVARIEAGTPLAPLDVPEGLLPQELGRDARMISFKKGCYLGQETVARLDALGHVNKQLAGLEFATGAAVGAGSELLRDGKPAGVVTSVAHRAAGQPPIGLGFVRRECLQPGTELLAAETKARIVSLPMA